MLVRRVSPGGLSALLLASVAFAQSHHATPAVSIPTDYHAVSNRTVYAKPAAPALGPAGWRFTDPTFGSRMLRVTDANTDPRSGFTGNSFSTPSAAHQLAWNATSDGFYARTLNGWYFAFSFNAATLTASRLQLPTFGGVIDTHIEPQFSFRSGNILYAATRDQTQPAHDYPVLHQYDFSTGGYSILLNLRTIPGVTINPDTYAGGISSSATSPENIAVMFGGQQDTHYKVAVFEAAAPQTTVVVLDTQASTLTRNGLSTPTSTTLSFLLHHTWMDLSGRYVVLYPVAGDPVHYIVWDLATDAFTPVTTLSFGHDALGYGWQVNQDCCTSGAPYDGAQWQLRALNAPQSTTDLIDPMPSPRQIFIADHTSWNNAQPDRLVPILSSTYRYFNGTFNTTPWRAWDDEIVAVRTDRSSGSTVWRFAHHRSNIQRDDGVDGTYFWYQPRGVISPNGRWALFTSNWEKSLGLMPVPDWNGIYRTDLFLVSLPAGTFTDDPLTAGVTPVRAIHLTELRERIDALRVGTGLQPYAWSDGVLAPGTTVRAVHLTELRTALQQAYAAAGRGDFPSLTDPVISPGVTTIRAVHIEQLRQAVVSLEGS